MEISLYLLLEFLIGIRQRSAHSSTLSSCGRWAERAAIREVSSKISSSPSKKAGN